MKALLRKHAMLWLVTILMAVSLWYVPPAQGFAAGGPAGYAEEWSREFGSPDNYNEPSQVLSLPGQGYIAVGTTTPRDEISSQAKIVAIKTDSSGNTEWEREYLDKTSPTERYTVQSMIQTRDGGFLIGGGMLDWSDGKPFYRAYLLKLSADGDPEWSGSYGEYRGYAPIQRVKETRNGGFIAVSWTSNVSGTQPAYILRVDAEGNPLWDHYYRGYQEQVLLDVVETQDEGFLAAGYAVKENSVSWLPLLVKYGPTGEISWSKTLPYEAGWGYVRQLMHAPGGDGYLMLDGSGLWKLTEDGEAVWRKGLVDAEFPELLSYMKPAPDGSGGYLISGRSDQRHLTLKIDEEGTILWSLLQNLAPRFYDAARTDIPQDGGLVWITSTFGSERLKLVKYKAVDEIPGESRFYLDSDDYSLSVDTQLDIVALFQGPDGGVKSVTEAAYFTIEDPSIASIDGSGNLTGLSPGLTRVIAEYAGFTDSATVLVVRPYVPPANRIEDIPADPSDTPSSHPNPAGP